MTYVLLQAPKNGYYVICVAASKKHFDLIDNDYMEIDSGEYEVMENVRSFFESQDTDDIIKLFCHDTLSEIHTTEECLHQLMKNDPNYLNNKEFL